MDSNNTELKHRKEKLKRETEELSYKPIIVLKKDLDKFEEQEMKNIRQIIISCFDQSIVQNVMGNNPIMIRDRLKDKMITDILKLFKTKEEKE